MLIPSAVKLNKQLLAGVSALTDPTPAVVPAAVPAAVPTAV